MTYEEARVRFESFDVFCDDRNDACDNNCDKCKEMEDYIIEALEKQISVVPIYSDYDDNGAGELIPCTATCPFCGHEFEFGDWNEWENPYCKCGQKMDWGEY